MPPNMERLVSHCFVRTGLYLVKVPELGMLYLEKCVPDSVGRVGALESSLVA